MFKNQDKRDAWLHKLHRATNSRKFEDYYIIGHKIGKGKFSDVYECCEIDSNTKWAVKVIRKHTMTPSEIEMLRAEMAIHRILDHPNIVKVKDIFDSRYEVLLVCEFIKGGELYSVMHYKKKLPEYTACHITKELLEAAKYLHEVGVIHRDIKPENILISSNCEVPHIKITDFGLSKLCRPGEIQT